MTRHMRITLALLLLIAADGTFFTGAQYAGAPASTILSFFGGVVLVPTIQHLYLWLASNAGD